MAHDQPSGSGGPERGQRQHEAPQDWQAPPQPPYQQQPPYGPPGGHNPEADARQWGMLAHILAGMTALLGPLIIWAVKKDDHPFPKDQVTEALNFGITVTFAYVAVGILMSIVSTVVPLLGLLFIPVSPNARMTLVIDVPNSISRISRPQSCTEGIGTIGRRICQMQYSEANLRAGESRVFEAQFVGTWRSGDEIVFSMPSAVGLNDPNRFNLATAPLP